VQFGPEADPRIATGATPPQTAAVDADPAMER